MFLVVKHSLREKRAASKKSVPLKAIKKSYPKRKADAKQEKKNKKAATEQLYEERPAKESTRPRDEVVTYNEVEYELKEIPSHGTEILIGPQRLTRFEKARIIGARSIQLSLGAPFLVKVPAGVNDSISLATVELQLRALPISIRRVLPNGLYQDIAIDWLK